MFNLEQQLGLSKSGKPCLSEAGGGNTNTGESTVICGSKGEPLTPIYVPRGGNLCNGEHAVFVVETGFFIIRGSHHRGDFHIVVEEIGEISQETNEPALPENCFSAGSPSIRLVAKVRVAHEFSQGEWDNTPPEYLSAAIEAAMGKAQDYHCRTPWYVATEEVGQPLPGRDK